MRSIPERFRASYDGALYKLTYLYTFTFYFNYTLENLQISWYQSDISYRTEKQRYEEINDDICIEVYGM